MKSNAEDALRRYRIVGRYCAGIVFMHTVQRRRFGLWWDTPIKRVLPESCRDRLLAHLRICPTCRAQDGHEPDCRA